MGNSTINKYPIILLFYFFTFSSAHAQEFDMNTLFGRAQQASYDGDFLTALKLCKQAIKEDSIHSDSYYLLAQIYSDLDSIAAEKDILILAQKKFPQNEEISFRLGKVKMALAEYNDAIEDFIKVLKLIEEKGYVSYLTISASFELGNAFLKLKKYEKAIEFYSFVLNQQPHNSSALVNRGMAYFNSKQKAKACDDWNKGYNLGIHEVHAYIKKYCISK